MYDFARCAIHHEAVTVSDVRCVLYGLEETNQTKFN